MSKEYICLDDLWEIARYDDWDNVIVRWDDIDNLPTMSPVEALKKEIGMRCATKEEIENVRKYIDNISIETGVNFYDN